MSEFAQARQDAWAAEAAADRQRADLADLMPDAATSLQLDARATMLLAAEVRALRLTLVEHFTQERTGG